VNVRIFRMLSYCLAAMLVLISSSLRAATCPATFQAESGPGTVPVIELYTSEGCDSCPPMDKWFSTLTFKKQGAVPLAFHVDYWDYIGWKDRFARPSFGERQRSEVTRQGSRTVYTPQVLFNGKDARGETSDKRISARAREISNKKSDAKLKLRGELTNDKLEAIVNIEFADAKLNKDAALYVAVSENNLVSQVTAGENRGVRLTHDHVVREFSGPFPITFRADATATNNAANEVKHVITLPKEWKRADLNLVAFIQNTRSGETLQTVTTPICAP
jgi:hypothetical protein